VSDALVERRAEIAAIERLVSDVRGGRGRALVIAGPAGIGKSSLLARALVAAKSLGVPFLAGYGAERERTLPYGLARRLFDRRLARIPTRAKTRLLAGIGDEATATLTLSRAEAFGAEARHAALLGLYGLLAGFSESTGLLVVVDDVHWSDDGSLEWLAFTARRLQAGCVSLLVAASTDELWRGERAVRVFEDAGAEVVEPAPLSAPGAGRLLRARTALPMSPAFVQAVHDSTGGSPFLLGEVARALADGGPADGVPRPTRQLERFVAVRLDRLGADARQIADAVAVLGRGSALRDAAGVARLDIERAAKAADALRRAGVLAADADLRFCQPLVAQAAYQRLAPSCRALMHAQAARVLDGAGASTAAVARHLLRTEPAGDRWIVRRLIAAAEEALQSAAPASAVSFLRRAEREGTAEGRAGLLAALGRTEVVLGDTSALEHLGAAHRCERHPLRRAEVARSLAHVLMLSGEPEKACALIQRELPAVRASDPDLAARIEADMLATARTVPACADRVTARLRSIGEPAGRTPGERALLASAAAERVARGVDSARAVRLAEVALADGPAAREAAPASFLLACMTLSWCGRPADATERLDEMVEEARRRGSAVPFAQAVAWRARAHLAAGAIAPAVSDAREAREALLVMPGVAHGPLGALVRAWLALGLLEQDRPEEAEAVLAEAPCAGEAGADGFVAPVAYARGILDATRHEPARALEHFLAAGRIQLAIAVPGPAVLPWRSAAAQAHAALGDDDAAYLLAHEELVLAERCGVPHVHGIALRALASVGPPEPRIALQREAVRVLARSEARLDHGKAVCDLGASLRRSGHRREARPPLREALEVATGCGAPALARRAREELAASGARPRRSALTGQDALTPAELRVARLASEGLSNREIAQTLFLSVKTVETELGHAYAKLGITSRRALPAVLGGV
jgi:DNA-binding CsgD family transcriptional regulator